MTRWLLSLRGGGGLLGYVGGATERSNRLCLLLLPWLSVLLHLELVAAHVLRFGSPLGYLNFVQVLVTVVSKLSREASRLRLVRSRHVELHALLVSRHRLRRARRLLW